VTDSIEPREVAVVVKAAGPLRMRISMAELAVYLAHLNRERLRDDRRWLTGWWKQPILLTATGDAFLQDAARHGPRGRSSAHPWRTSRAL
jgi:hypothetical protein